MNPKIDAAHHRGYIEPNVAGYEALGPHTIRFRMKQPYFNAVGICGNLLFIIPRHVYGDFDEPTFNRDISDLVIGSGPWLLDSWTKGQQIVLVRNENYWGPKPALRKQIIRIVSNELSKMQEFRAGNIDYLRRPSPEQWVQTVDASWFRERGAQAIRYYTPRAGYQYLGYNLRRPYFADKRTRRALTMLLDRESIIDTLRNGMGVAITGPFYFKSDQYDSSIEPWPYDPDRARRLLAEVGWRDTDGDGVLDMDLDGDGIREPFEFTFRVPSGLSFYDRLQRFVQNAFKSAGIKVNLDQIEWSVFLERLNERQYDMVSLIWTGEPESDPYQIWHSTQEANRGSNHIGFNDPQADQLIETARRTMDYDDRMRLWHEFHTLLHEEQPYTFLFAKPEQAFLHERFQNVLMHDYKLWQSEWYVPAQAQLR
jgi:peptide/nickel transport system substrate-binding protein